MLVEDQVMVVLIELLAVQLDVCAHILELLRRLFVDNVLALDFLAHIY